MAAKICLLIVGLMLLSGCAAATEPPKIMNGIPPAIAFEDLEQLFVEIAVVKFSDESMHYGAFCELRDIRELYIPRNESQGLQVARIDVWIIPESFGKIEIRYHHSVHSHDPAWFLWNPSKRADIATAEDREFLRMPTQDRQGPDVAPWRHSALWVQHGYEFEARIPLYFTVDDVYEFCYAMPVVAWELQGNAVSVSIESMGDVSIFDDDGVVIVDELQSDTHLSWDGYSVLYRNSGENLNKIGYRWQVVQTAGQTLKHQYVLEPGTYTFHVDAIEGESGLLVRHFVDHEIVSEVDFAETFAGQDVDRFTLTVTIDPNGSTLELN